MIEVIGEVDDWALWLAAVVAGLTALGWIGRRTRRAYNRLKPWVCKLQAVLDIAEYELQHNGGGSIKDAVSEIPALRRGLSTVSDSLDAHLTQSTITAERANVEKAAVASRLAELEKAARHQAEALGEQAAAIGNLAEALPVVARSQPHPDDAAKE